MNTIKLAFPSDSIYSATASESVATIFAKLFYQVGYDEISESVEIVVPDDFSEFEIYFAFESLCADYIQSQGGQFGFVRFRVDGSNRARCLKEWIRDVRYQLTRRGTPVTREHKFH